MSGEIWKPYLEGYEASNMGRVRSLDRVLTCDHYGSRLWKGRFLKYQIDPRSGYPRISICIKRVPKTVFIHRIVALVFIPNPENKPQINHKNGIKTDCRAENLEWVTPSENSLHSFRTGLSKSTVGMASSFHKLKDHDVIAIRASNLERKELAKQFNVIPETIKKIQTRKTWTHI